MLDELDVGNTYLVLLIFWLEKQAFQEVFYQLNIIMLILYQLFFAHL